MRSIVHRYRLPVAVAGFFPCVALLSFFLSVERASAQAGGSVSTKITLSGLFPGKAVVVPPRENLPDDVAEVVSYPADALKEGVQGTVKLAMTIGADGSIRKSEVTDNGGDSRLLNAALQGLRRTGFLPGTVDGVPTEMDVAVEVRFFIRKEERAEPVEVSDLTVAMAPVSRDKTSEEVDEMDAFVPGVKYPEYSRAELSRLLTYPEVAQENGIEGEVTVSVQIDTQGKPLKAVIRSSTHKVFEAATLNAVRKMTYTPGVQDGHPVQIWLTFKVEFRLEDPVPDSTAQETAPEKAEKKDGVEEYGMDDYVEGAVGPGYNMDQMRELLQYPRTAQQNGIEGQVVVSVRIDTDGRVLDAVVRQSSNKIFEVEAVKAARALKFTPAIKDGKPVRMWTTIAVQFRLN